MENSSLLTNWMNFNQRYNHIWSIFILSLMGVSFVVTDWMIGIFTLSDYIFAIVGASLVVSGNYRIKRNQMLWIVLLLGVIVANIVMNVNMNESFVLKTGVAALVRIAYYATLVTGVYNYVKEYELEAQFLRILNIIAVTVGIIGIYITIALYSEGNLPYEFFWTFTRTDQSSYFFQGNPELIRTRSILSEPAYLGYLLNIIVTMNLFNKVNVKINKIYLLIISIVVVLTFSYSAIGTMFLIYILYFMNKLRLRKVQWSKKNIIVMLFAVILIILFWDYFNHTIIQRTALILSGEDTSAYNRLVTSWTYVNTEQIFEGNGIGHTPNIWNIYAYVLSDLGVVALIFSILFSLYILYTNVNMGLIFIALNFQKGGYLNPVFAVFLLLIFIYMRNKRESITL